MKLERIGLHKLRIYACIWEISTVKLGEGLYETLIWCPKDGDELDCIRTTTLDQAKRTHLAAVRYWNDRAYEGSTERCLHFPNVGQFVKPIVCPDITI